MCGKQSAQEPLLQPHCRGHHTAAASVLLLVASRLGVATGETGF